jgi:hypothetical protein
LRTSAAVALPTLVIVAPVAGSTTSSDPPAAVRHSLPKTRPRQVSSTRNFPAGAFIALPSLLLALHGRCRPFSPKAKQAIPYVIFNDLQRVPCPDIARAISANKLGVIEADLCSPASR